MKDKKLEVGDRVLRWHGTFDPYLRAYSIVRLTPKRAILNDGTQVVNDLFTNNGFKTDELSAKIVGELYEYVILSTPTLEQSYKEQSIRRKAKKAYDSIRVKELSIAQCEQLITLFPLPKNNSI